MQHLDLRKEDTVYVVTMIDIEHNNTFTEKVLEEHHRILEEIEATPGNCSAVLTSNNPKTWSQGINLEWLVPQPHTYYEEFKSLMDKFLIRWALLDVPTVGCLTGHTFAGGAILASGLDFRFMREDRGWLCFPEVDIKIPFTPIMHGIVDLLPNRQALRDLLLTGKKIGGKEAAELGIVDAAYPQEILLEKSMEFAAMLAGKDRSTYAAIKKGMRSSLVAMKEGTTEGCKT